MANPRVILLTRRAYDLLQEATYLAEQSGARGTARKLKKAKNALMDVLLKSGVQVF